MQQVNFYHPIYHPRFDPLAARSMVGFAGALLGLVILVTAFMQWRLAGERAGLQKLRTQKEALATRVADLGVRYPVREARADLVQIRADLEREKGRKNSMLSLLNEGKIGNTAGFAGVLRELSLSRTEGAWLTGIGVFEGGHHLLIEGAAFQSEAERIPELWQAIMQRPLFAERTFGRLAILPVKERAELLQFQIKTDPERSLDRFWEKKEEDGTGHPAVQKGKKILQTAPKEAKP
ncbi:MAG: hypothetical protein G8237_15035 [Magnetococcales bacterium]|nr:hypothetical protein [Magnetococcales bacterium]